jgi:hypothetical protein
LAICLSPVSIDFCEGQDLSFPVFSCVIFHHHDCCIWVSWLVPAKKLRCWSTGGAVISWRSKDFSKVLLGCPTIILANKLDKRRSNLANLPDFVAGSPCYPKAIGPARTSWSWVAKSPQECLLQQSLVHVVLH